MPTTYSSLERTALIGIALLGAIGLNGAFVYALVVQPDLVRDALTNPVSLAFVIEAFVVMGLLAVYLRRWGAAERSGALFVLLALLGGIAFALPVHMLWKRRAAEQGQS